MGPQLNQLAARYFPLEWKLGRHNRAATRPS